METKLSRAQLKALSKAAERPTGAICPVVGVHAAAEDALIKALDRHGFVTWEGSAPRINDAGRAALSKARGES